MNEEMNSTGKSKSGSFAEDSLKLKAIFNSAIDGIIAIDKHGIIETVNPAICKLFGYDKQELIGENVSFLMPSPHRQRHDQYIQRYLDTGEKKIIGIGRVVEGKRKDGSTFPFRLSVSEVKLKDRILFTGVVHDISEQRAAEEKIRKLNRELEQRVTERTEKLEEVVNHILEKNRVIKEQIAKKEQLAAELKNREEEALQALEKEKELSEMKNRFVSIASHEFRTPLSTILSSVSLIGRYTKTEQQEKREKHIKRIKNAINHLTDILNDFLSLSKLEEGRVDMHIESFDMVDLCEEVMGDMMGILKEGQEIIHQCDLKELPMHTDKRLLKNVLFNLMSNAIKYSPTDTQITCTIRKKEADVQIEVKDQGRGIPRQDWPYLFTRFFRASNSGNAQGTGLGLNIVRRYVDLLQGSIQFTSEVGKGSVFYIRLPAEINHEENTSNRG